MCGVRSLSEIMECGQCKGVICDKMILCTCACIHTGKEVKALERGRGLWLTKGIRMEGYWFPYHICIH